MIILITSTLGEPYLALLQQPGFLVPVLPEQFQGPLGRAQAAVRRGAVDTLTVVFKLDISRALETRLVLLYQSQGVLGPAWTRAKQEEEEEERQKIREWRRTLEDTKPEEEAKKEKGGMKTVESRRKREGGREGSNEHRYKERYKSFGGGSHWHKVTHKVFHCRYVHLFKTPTHVPLVNITACFMDALQALVNDGHHMLLRVREQDVAVG